MKQVFEGVPMSVQVDDATDAQGGYAVMWKGETFADQLSKADAEKLAGGMSLKAMNIRDLHNVLFYQMGWDSVDVGAFMFTCEALGLTEQGGA